MTSMSTSLNTNLSTIKKLLAQEQEGKSINNLDALHARQARRAFLWHLLEEIDWELEPIRQAIRDLPELPPEEQILWAQSVLKMQSALLMEIDTTGLGDDAEICRIAFASPNGSILHDMFIKPECARLTEEAKKTNGLTDDQLAIAPSLVEMWPRLQEILQGHYVISFAQDFDRNVLTCAVKKFQLLPIYLIGDDLQRQLTRYYHREYYLTLKNVYERMSGEPLSEPATAVARVQAAANIIAGMASCTVDVRPPRQHTSCQVEPVETSDDLADLDDHPF